MWLYGFLGKAHLSLADGLLGPAAPFKISQSLIPLQRLYAAEIEDNEESQPTDPTQANGHKTVAPSKEAIVENAITREWHRIRLHSMGLAV